MAGDIGVREQVLVLPAGELAQEAQAAIVQASAGVTHQYGSRVVITGTPVVAQRPMDGPLAAAVMTEEPLSLSDAQREGLDEQGIMGLEAFALRQSDAYMAAKAQRPLDGEPWDCSGGDIPDVHEELEAGAAALEAGAAPTSARLTGRVAVGVIIVEGPTNALKFSAAERTKVVAEVQNGLGWLGSKSSPAGITWVYDIRIVSVTAQPNANDTTSGQKEARWRDPAMNRLGFGTGMAAVQNYVQQLRTSKGADWAYCAFFTKFPLGHFAYATLGGPRLVMHYDNDGWGPDNIDRVFAHETGHIFNAPDEYASSGCNCGGQWGVFNVPNVNCENCASGGGVPCIMKSNSWEMCAYTPYHLGFPQGQRYSGVFRAGTGSYGLWVNADWNHFIAKWQQWNQQGLRLTDLEISQPGGQLRYSGVFQAGSGGYGLWAMAAWNSFTSQWQQWSGQGLRLVDLEVTKVGNDYRYSGVFRQGSGGHGLWAMADWNSFHSKWQQWSSQGLRLVDFTVTQVGNQMRYSGVFRQGSGGHGLWVLADWNSFVSKWQQWSGQGLRLVDLEITKVGNENRYSGVFQAGSGGHGLWVNADWASFVTKWQQWNDQGLRLIDFDITLTGVENMASPVAGAQAQGEEEDAAGYGFLSRTDSDESWQEDSGAGYGFVSIPGADLGADQPGGSGYGSVTLSEVASGEAADSAGIGMVVLSETASQSSSDAATAGFGMVSLPDGLEEPDASVGAGFGSLTV